MRRSRAFLVLPLLFLSALSASGSSPERNVDIEITRAVPHSVPSGLRLRCQGNACELSKTVQGVIVARKPMQLENVRQLVQSFFQLRPVDSRAPAEGDAASHPLLFWSIEMDGRKTLGRLEAEEKTRFDNTTKAVLTLEGALLAQIYL